MTTTDWKNQLYFGDNLDILRNRVADASVDLIYLDPPFNSNANYNVLFQEKSGQQSAAQITAFEDTWHWNLDSESAYQDVVTNAHGKLPDLLQAMRSFLGDNDMMAYLTMMAQRMVELHRVLKDTGSIYLHCDPTASHYLKLLLDAVFGAGNFRNEITWKRFNFHADAKRFGRIADRILLYSKSTNYQWNQQRTPFKEDYLASHFRYTDQDGRLYRLDNLNPPGGRGPVYEFNGITRAWRYTQENMQKLENDGRIFVTPGRVPQLKRYLDELQGEAVNDIWSDIPPINPRAKERLGYPTQKPEALLERIVSASSNEGDVVLDPLLWLRHRYRRRRAPQPPLDRHRHHPHRHHPDTPPPARHLQGRTQALRGAGPAPGRCQRPGPRHRQRKLRALPIRVVGPRPRGRPPGPGPQEGRRLRR